MQFDEPSRNTAPNAQAGRDDSRLEFDDERFCKWCGTELPEWLVNGPIAGGDSDTPAVELCGSCLADDMQYRMPPGEIDARKFDTG